MGSWWHVQVGNHEVPVFGKNFVSDELMLVFADADRYLDTAKLDDMTAFERQLDDHPEFEVDERPASWQTRLMGYAAEAGVLRSRLDLQGFSSDRVRSLCTAFFDDELADSTEEGSIDWRDSWPEGRSKFPNGAAVTAALSTRRGLSAAVDLRPHSADPEKRFLHHMWESLRWSFDDPRFSLALALTNTRSTTVVTLDLTDLVVSGYLTADQIPHQEARARMVDAIAASGPVIVITEGVSDARWLRRALETAAPAVAHLFKFLDFVEYRAPGGTDRVVSLTKGMAAASVMNRIVAVLDNDTAGREAAAQLAIMTFPARVAVAILPEVAYASRYPTLGPAGPAVEDVNGRATSIEFMFGDDILRDSNGTLFPVRWQSFNETAAEYQGRLTSHHKATVDRRIDQALGGTDGSGVPEQVLDGCLRLAGMLLDAADPPLHIPASEFSDLSASWRSSQVGQARSN